MKDKIATKFLESGMMKDACDWQHIKESWILCWQWGKLSNTIYTIEPQKDAEIGHTGCFLKWGKRQREKQENFMKECWSSKNPSLSTHPALWMPVLLDTLRHSPDAPLWMTCDPTAVTAASDRFQCKFPRGLPQFTEGHLIQGLIPTWGGQHLKTNQHERGSDQIKA